MGAVNRALEGFKGAYQTADPGDGNRIVITRQNQVIELRINGTETNTLSAPIKAGIICTIAVERLDSGSRAVTVDGGSFDQTNTIATFNTDADVITFKSVPNSAVSGTFTWSLLNNVGCTLS